VVFKMVTEDKVKKRSLLSASGKRSIFQDRWRGLTRSTWCFTEQSVGLPIIRDGRTHSIFGLTIYLVTIDLSKRKTS